MTTQRVLFGAALLAACLSGAAVSSAQNSYDTAKTISPNDSLAVPMSIGTDQYWWKVTTPDDGKLVVTTRWATQPVTEIYVYDVSPTQLGRSTTEGSAATATLEFLGKETYYIRVLRKSGDGACTLLTRFTPAPRPNDQESNDIAEKAMTLLIGGSGTGHLGYYTVGNYDQVDWWKTTTSAEGVVTASVQCDETLSINLILYDENKQEVGRASSSGSNPVARLALFAGTYYLKSVLLGGQGSYTITCTVTPEAYPSEREPNDQTYSAIPIAIGSTYIGHIGYSGKGARDLDDYYSFSLATKWSNLYIRSESNPGLSIVISLLDSGGGLITAGRVSGTTGFLVRSDIGSTIGSTSFFVQIHCSTGFGTYAFVVSDSSSTPVKKQIAPPSNLTVSDIPSDNGHTLALSWSLSPDDLFITEYRILRSRSKTLTEERDLSTFATVEALMAAEQDSTILIARVPKGQSSYIDPFVPVNGVPYYYWIEAVALSGATSQKIAARTPTAVQERRPDPFTVYPPYPNPFNPSTTFRYEIPETGPVSLRVYDVLGRAVAVLEDRVLSAGAHETLWNGRDDRGITVASGIYLFRLQAGAYVHAGKVMFLR